MIISRFRAKEYKSLKDFEINLGAKHTLVGKNNVGKSTLIKGLLSLIEGPSSALEGCIEPYGNNSKPDSSDESELSGILSELNEYEKEAWLKKFSDFESEEPKKFLVEIRRIRKHAGTSKGKGLEARLIENLLRGEGFSSIKPLTDFKPISPADIKAAPILMPQVIFLPADEQLDSALKGVKSIGNLIFENVIQESKEEKAFKAVLTALEDFQNALQQANKGSAIDKFNDKLSSHVFGDWEAQVKVGASSNIAVDDILKKFIQFNVLDGKGNAISFTEEGHGWQKSFLIALTRMRTSMEQMNMLKSSPSVLILAEEPELYLHPQAQRTLNMELGKMTKTPGTQVIIGTHSPYMIDINKLLDISLFRKNKMGVTYHKMAQESEYLKSLRVKQEHAELFFADAVIIVEGETEVDCLNYLAQKCKQNDGLKSRSILRAGGKSNIAPLAELAVQFGIDVIAVYDTDNKKFDEDRDIKKLKEVNKSLMGDIQWRIIGIHPDFEAIANIPRNQKERQDLSKKNKKLYGSSQFNNSKPTEALQYFENAHPLTQEIQVLLNYCFDAFPESSLGLQRILRSNPQGWVSWCKEKEIKDEKRKNLCSHKCEECSETNKVQPIVNAYGN